MNGDTWMPFYIGDYLRDTMHLSSEQHGCYILLICHCWVHGTAQDDDAILRAITKCPESSWARTKPILRAFFEVKSGAWSHQRVDEEKAAAADMIERRKRQTERATAARWSSVTDNDTQSVTHNETLSVTERPSPSPSPSQPQKDVGRMNRPSVKTETDLEWVNGLKSNPAFAGMDVERELAKMTAWCQANRKLPSRRRFVNWLNRVEMPIAGARMAAGASDRVIADKERERVENRLRLILAQYSDHQTMTPKDRLEVAKLRARRDELKKLLGVTI